MTRRARRRSPLAPTHHSSTEINANAQGRRDARTGRDKPCPYLFFLGVGVGRGVAATASLTASAAAPIAPRAFSFASPTTLEADWARPETVFSILARVSSAFLSLFAIIVLTESRFLIAPSIAVAVTVEAPPAAVFSDPDAEYAATFEINLDEIHPMVALPGDPRNGIPIESLKEEVRIDAAYGGSCTGGKMADMDMYAEVLANALAAGKRVAEGVHLYIQFGSQKIKQYARSKGYIEIFGRAGAELIDPSCGACINAGPGASPNAETVTVSAQNRNFPGRSGPGKLYLASPYVVAASAIAGKIVEPAEYLTSVQSVLTKT